MLSVDIDRHIFQTYKTLRWGIAGLALSFPVVLVVLGLILGVDGIAKSWSSYYHLSPVTRDVLVGFLCAIGVFFILYRGYSPKENIALNVGGFFAICVAMFPTNLYDAGVKGLVDPCADDRVPVALVSGHGHTFLRDEAVIIGENQLTGVTEGVTCDTSVHVHILGSQKFVVSVHGLSAVVFFLSAAFVACFTSSATLEKLKNPPLEKAFKVFYITAGAAMFFIPVAVLAAKAIGVSPGSSPIFWMETGGLAAFISYWIVKSIELQLISDELILSDPNLLEGMGVQLRK